MQKTRAGTETFFKGGISECFPRGSNTPFINSFKTKHERIKGEQGRARSISVSCYFRVSTRSTFLRWQSPGASSQRRRSPHGCPARALGTRRMLRREREDGEKEMEKGRAER